MGHPDFRANGRIFATLSPDGTQGMVKLTPAQQQAFSAIYSEALTKSGQGERAADELRKVAAAKPNDPDIQYQYGAMAFNAGDIAAAVGAFEKAYRLKSSDTKYAKAYINALVRAGRESNDNSSYTRAIEPARRPASRIRVSTSGAMGSDVKRRLTRCRPMASRVSIRPVWGPLAAGTLS